MAAEPTRLVIVDDHAVVRTGLAFVLDLDPAFTVVGEAASGEEFLARLEQDRPSVVLMDVEMAGIGGIEACRRAKATRPDLRVLMLTSHGEEQAVVAAVEAGADGYVLKNVGRQELLQALRAVVAGQGHLDPAVTPAVTRRLVDSARQPVQRATSLLSERELEVLALLARGLINKEIATELGLSEKTARNHVSHILEKLGVANRTEAVAHALQHGLVSTVPLAER